ALPPAQLAQVGLEPQSLDFSAPHDPTEPLALRFRVTGERAGEQVTETFETWYGAQYGRNWQVDGTPLYALPTPERHLTFLKPDKIEKVRNAKPQVLFCRGPYGHEYLPPSIFSALDAQVTPSYFQPAGTWPASLNVFPVSYEDLMALDIIALINVDAAALGDTGMEMLKDFVNHGGTLIYGGDLWAYSRGNVTGTVLDKLLPVSFSAPEKQFGALQAMKGKTVTFPGNIGKPLAPDAVLAYLAENFTVKPEARVLLICGNHPVAVSWPVGQGRVIAITGTVLGDAPRGKTLFTRTPQWRALMADLLKASFSPLASSEKLVPRLAGSGAGPSDNELNRINSPKANKTKVTENPVTDSGINLLGERR
ncbi:MAG: hypothetical protein KKF10_04655, partial [Verrucomicrobia bacterium]|nr:hypothetical protein [Verrucomicrobiota bacterium]